MFPYQNVTLLCNLRLFDVKDRQSRNSRLALFGAAWRWAAGVPLSLFLPLPFYGVGLVFSFLPFVLDLPTAVLSVLYTHTLLVFFRPGQQGLGLSWLARDGVVGSPSPPG
ncbi:Clathrin light chain, partial [Fusarium oxysporum f. sp. albedinis]